MPKTNGKGEEYYNPILDTFGPDIAKAAMKAMRNMPFREKWTKSNGKWQKGGLIKGKPKLTKRGW